MRYVRTAPALLLVIAIALTIAYFASPASAETITVTREDDPSPDGCTNNGCTFREAADLGNTTAGNQIIDIGDKEIVLTSGITLTGDMTIMGVDDVTSIIRINPGAQIFNISAVANVTFTKVWIYGATAGGPGNCGGAIYNAGELNLTHMKVAKNFITGKGAGLCNVGTATLDDVNMSANSASGNTGGAIFNSGTMTILNSTITQNQAIEGAGISNDAAGTMTIEHSHILDNTADTNLCSDCASGGGIATSGTLTLEDSTVADNTADNGAGLVSRGTTTIRRSTFSGNQAGAINNSDGTMTIVRSTISNNIGKSGSTAGIAGISNNSTLSLINSTIADNPASGFQYGGLFTNTTASSSYKATIFSNNGPNNCHTGGNQSSLGYNVYAPMTNACETTGPGDQEVADAMIGALANNGGPTMTRLPQVGSVAINTGGPGCPTPDQLGSLLVGGCDAGAAEYGGVPITATASPTVAPPADSYPMGDVGCSDSVTIEDLVPALKLVTKLAPPDRCGREALPCFNFENACYPPWVDTNCDNQMTGVDVVRIAAHLAGAPILDGCPNVGEYIPHN